jgi:hypothetical protein
MQLMVESCHAQIKSIEIQLVRVETCGCAEGYAKDGRFTCFHLDNSSRASSGADNYHI